MNACAAILIATSALGIQFGLAPGSDGKDTYTIQLDPYQVEKMLDGTVATTVVPMDDGTSVSVQIRVGTTPLKPVTVKSVHGYHPPETANELPVDPLVVPIDNGTQTPIDPNAPPEHDTNTDQPDEFEQAATAELPNPIQKTGHERPDDPSASDNPDTAVDPKDTETPDANQSKTASKPWLPLMSTVIGLVASLGGNIYMGWIVLDLRERYRKLLRSSREKVVG